MIINESQPKVKIDESAEQPISTRSAKSEPYQPKSITQMVTKRLSKLQRVTPFQDPCQPELFEQELAILITTVLPSAYL